MAFAAPAVSQEEIPDLDPRLAQRLLAQSLEVNEAQITVAYVLRGTKKLEKGFETGNASTIIYVTSVLEDGHRRRRCRQQIFLYDRKLGWFLEEIVSEGFRDYLRIWSQREGYLEIK